MRPSPPAARALPALLALVAAAAPACDDASPLRVRVCGDLTAPADLDALRVRTLDEARAAETFAGVFALVDCERRVALALPQAFDLPAPEPPAWLVVEGLRDGVAVATAERRLRASGGREVVLSLARDCLGVACAPGQACAAGGACAPVPFEDEAAATCLTPAPPRGEPAPDAADDDAEADGEADEDAEADAGPDVPLPCPGVGP